MTTIRVRRNTAAGATASNPILAAGEIGAETDTGKIKVGDGSTRWNALPYGGAAGYSPGGTDVAVADGGTGASTASTARTNLGLAIGTNVQAWDADLDALAAMTAPATKLGGIQALADVTGTANVDAAGAVMNTDTSTASMSFVVDEDAMTSNSATKVPTQQSVKAYVDSASGSSAAQESTYVITKVGSTITATPRAGSGFSAYSGTDAYTVIQAAITALTPSGGSGSGGGKIHICQGDYGLSNELTIVGWEGVVASNSQPFSQLIIEGDGMKTQIYQNTSAKNVFKINNCANVVMTDMKLYSGTNAKSCILGDNDGATSVMSMWKSVFNNLHCHSDATGSPCVLIKDFFELAVPWMRVYSTQNSGVVLQQTDTLVKRGNSWIGSLSSASSASSPHAGLRIESTTSAAVIDMITIDNYQCTTPSYYGIYLYGAVYNNFLFTDIESAQYCVYADGPTSGSYQYSQNNTFHSGYWQPADNGEGFHGTTHAFATTIDGVAIYTRGDGTVKAIVDANTGAASDYKIYLPNGGAAPDLAAISIGYAGTRLRIVANGTSYTDKLPNGTTAITQSPGNNSTKLATTAYADAAGAGGGYTPGGTDVAVTDGGTGRSTSATAYGLLAAGTTATGVHQTLAAGATTEVLVGGGSAALPAWTTATGSGAPVRATSPTLVTPALGTPSAGVLTNCTGLTTAGVAPATLITASETIGSNNNDTTLPTSAAVKAYADSVSGGGFASTFADVSFTGAPAQTVTASTWTQLNMNTESSDAGNNYDNATNFWYTIPATGIYQFFAMVRLMDSSTLDLNLAIGISPSAGDGVWVQWSPVKTDSFGSRAAYQYLRNVQATAGQHYLLAVYCDAAGSIGVKSAQMTAIRVG